jgi:hypothetical protein
MRAQLLDENIPEDRIIPLTINPMLHDNQHYLCEKPTDSR